VLSSGKVFNLNNYQHSHNFDYKREGLTLRECRNGPKYYFTVKANQKVFRVFIGDVNDFFNIQCLYMMTAVVSIGAIDHAEKLVEIYDNPMKRIRFGNTRLAVNPFENSKLTPVDPNIQQVSKNVKILSFDIEDSSLPSKEIVFYHKMNLSMTKSENIFRELARFSESGNVLYIVDHLQQSSVTIFGNFLRRYRGFSVHHLHNLRYKRLNLFPRTIMHSHERPHRAIIQKHKKIHIH